jgi:hypothetical protein
MVVAATCAYLRLFLRPTSTPGSTVARDGTDDQRDQTGVCDGKTSPALSADASSMIAERPLSHRRPCISRRTGTDGVPKYPGR